MTGASDESFPIGRHRRVVTAAATALVLLAVGGGKALMAQSDGPASPDASQAHPPSLSNEYSRHTALQTAVDALEAHRQTLHGERGDEAEGELADTLGELARGLRAASDAAAALDDVTGEQDIIEARIAGLLDREDILRRALDESARSIGALTKPMLAAARAPLPLSLSTTSDPLAAARSAMVARSIMSDINRDMSIMRTENDELTHLGALLEDERAALAAGGQREADRLADLEASIVDKRAAVEELAIEPPEDLMQSLDAALEELEREADRVRAAGARRDALGVAATSNGEALPRLAGSPRPEIDPGAGDEAGQDGDGRVDREELAAAGIHLPALGRIVTAFGAPDRFGDPLPGMRIASTPDGEVVAPLNGTIRFSGEFGGYGRLLILEHGGGYHSLIAGFGSVSVSAGETVAAGEVLGTAPRSQNGQASSPHIYFEVRQDGHPVAPIEGLARAQERGRG